MRGSEGCWQQMAEPCWGSQHPELCWGGAKHQNAFQTFLLEWEIFIKKGNGGKKTKTTDGVRVPSRGPIPSLHPKPCVHPPGAEGWGQHQHGPRSVPPLPGSRRAGRSSPSRGGCPQREH